MGGRWDIFARRRTTFGLADYLGSLQEFRSGLDDNPKLLDMSQFLLEYPYASRLFPQALEAIAHLRKLGSPAVLSDGDIVFQPRKIQHSGIWDAVEGRVLIYLHKEKMLEAVAHRYPARHYVMVDDKVRILAAMKQSWGSKLTTIFPRQGHYALDAAGVAKYPSPDLTLETIGALAERDLSALAG